MRIYPVIDLKGGVVVHGKGGERDGYRPVVSRLVASAEPLAVARAFRERLSLRRLYVADLDALAGADPAFEVLAALLADGFELLVDAGARSAGGAARLLEAGVQEVVAALETLPDPRALEEIIALAGAERVVFSLDLKAGALLGERRGWPFASPEETARAAHAAGARRLLVLDLARVGSGSGPAHLELLRRLARELPGVELLAGGGVRSREDLSLLEAAGASAALVATALHDGSLGGGLDG
jgi:phosphoribosylformimino-5-aminoimidazole carboxamide ribotide isomerase